jgi:hypothetical protein
MGREEEIKKEMNKEYSTEINLQASFWIPK